MKYIKKIILLASLFVVFCSSFETVEAYKLEGWKLPSKYTTYKLGDRIDDTPNSVIATGWKMEQQFGETRVISLLNKMTQLML